MLNCHSKREQSSDQARRLLLACILGCTLSLVPNQKVAAESIIRFCADSVVYPSRGTIPADLDAFRIDITDSYWGEVWDDSIRLERMNELGGREPVDADVTGNVADGYSLMPSAPLLAGDIYVLNHPGCSVDESSPHSPPWNLLMRNLETIYEVGSELGLPETIPAPVASALIEEVRDGVPVRHYIDLSLNTETLEPWFGRVLFRYELVQSGESTYIRADGYREYLTRDVPARVPVDCGAGVVHSRTLSSGDYEVRGRVTSLGERNVTRGEFLSLTINCSEVQQVELPPTMPPQSVDAGMGTSSPPSSPPSGTEDTASDSGGCAVVTQTKSVSPFAFFTLLSLAILYRRRHC